MAIGVCKSIVENDDIKTLVELKSTDWAMYLMIINLYCHLPSKGFGCLYFSLEYIKTIGMPLDGSLLFEACYNKKYETIKILLKQSNVKWPKDTLTKFIAEDNLEAVSFSFHHGAEIPSDILNQTIGSDCYNFAKQNF